MVGRGVWRCGVGRGMRREGIIDSDIRMEREKEI